jgi:threonylcarbamoyladenosine tRNA methylthiotransferase MtaB
LQSTSDKILKSMRRRYTFNKFKKLCEYIKKKSPLASITTDYIVGYPSETLKEFNNSIEKIKKLKLANMHIFRYSKRKNTVAEKITDIVGDAERKRRFEIINNLNIEMKNNYFKKFINKRISILFENSSDSSVQIGHSNYFFTVKVISNINMQNILKEVIITKIQNNELYGII